MIWCATQITVKLVFFFASHSRWLAKQYRARRFLANFSGDNDYNLGRLAGSLVYENNTEKQAIMSIRNIIKLLKAY